MEAAGVGAPGVDAAAAVAGAGAGAGIAACVAGSPRQATQNAVTTPTRSIRRIGPSCIAAVVLLSKTNERFAWTPGQVFSCRRRNIRRAMRTVCAVVLAIAAGQWVASTAVAGHGFGSAITWNREISRLVYDRCASCHRPSGEAFSLMTYQDIQPRANAVKDAVLARRMPPWGAVKGFGHFRNDQSLSQEQIELVTKWVDGGIRRGNNPKMLPPLPTF